MCRPDTAHTSVVMSQACECFVHLKNVTQITSVFMWPLSARFNSLTNLRKFPDLVKLLMEMLQRESDRRAIDNICAAICRMITTHIEGVPVQVVSACNISWLYWILGFALGRTGNGNFPGNGQKTETGRTGKWKPRLNSGIE